MQRLVVEFEKLFQHYACADRLHQLLLNLKSLKGYRLRFHTVDASELRDPFLFGRIETPATIDRQARECQTVRRMSDVLVFRFEI